MQQLGNRSQGDDSLLDQLIFLHSTRECRYIKTPCLSFTAPLSVVKSVAIASLFLSTISRAAWIAIIALGKNLESI